MARLQKKKIIDKSKKKSSGSEEGSSLSVKNNSSGVLMPKKSSSFSEPRTKKIMEAVKEPGLFQKGAQFLREVRVELKKVTWSNRKQTAASTVVVIVLVFIIAAFLGLVDFSLSKLVQIVLA